jgi:hypothetical protein
LAYGTIAFVTQDVLGGIYLHGDSATMTAARVQHRFILLLLAATVWRSIRLRGKRA